MSDELVAEFQRIEPALRKLHGAKLDAALEQWTATVTAHYTPRPTAIDLMLDRIYEREIDSRIGARQ